MKMKMRVLAKETYQPQPPISEVDKRSRDINAINRVRRANIPKLSKSKRAKEKRDTALVASWFEPSKYKGFKANIK